MSPTSSGGGGGGRSEVFEDAGGDVAAVALGVLARLRHVKVGGVRGAADLHPLTTRRRRALTPVHGMGWRGALAGVHGTGWH